MLDVIFKLEKLYKPKTVYTKTEIKDYFINLEDFYFYEEDSKIYGWFESKNSRNHDEVNPKLILIRFKFTKGNLDTISAKPAHVIYILNYNSYYYLRYFK